MDAELKAKWVKALRSGKYKQTRNKLMDPGGYCCLGVLCDIQGADFVKIKKEFGTLGLQHSPREYLGVVPEAYRDRVARMNDDGCSFAEIADYIEANL